MTRINLRGPWAVAALATVVAASVASASDPCAGNCGTGQGCAGNQKLKPTCDTRMYPKFDACYIRQFCGPQISPNACFGYFPTNWRSWDAACGTGCVTGEAVPLPVKPMDPQPAPGGTEKPEDKKFPTAAPSLPAIPPVPAPRRDQSPVASFMQVGTVSVPSLRTHSSGIVQTSLIRSYAADSKR